MELPAVDGQLLAITLPGTRSRMWFVGQRVAVIFDDPLGLFVGGGEKFTRLLTEEDLIPHSDVLERDVLVVSRPIEEFPPVQFVASLDEILDGVVPRIFGA